jgi:hypothetical protein
MTTGAACANGCAIAACTVLRRRVRFAAADAFAVLARVDRVRFAGVSFFALTPILLSEMRRSARSTCSRYFSDRAAGRFVFARTSALLVDSASVTD